MKTSTQRNSSKVIFTLLLFTIVFVINFENSYAQLNHNRAVRLLGNEDSYLSAKPNTINITGSFTLEAWVKPVSNLPAYIVCKGSLTAYYGLFISNGRLSVITNDVQRIISKTATSIPLNKWTHVAGTFDSTSNLFAISINGKLDTTATVAGSKPQANFDSLYIGKKGDGKSVLSFDGYMDEIRIWSKAVTVTDIGRMFRNSLGYSTSGAYSFLKASFTFQGDHSATNSYIDYSNLGNALTPHGTSITSFQDEPTTFLSYNDALKLDGTGDFFYVTNSASVTPIDEISIEAWIYPLDKMTRAIVGKNYVTSYYLGLSPSGFLRFIPKGIANGFVDGDMPIPLNQWTHVAATYKSGKAIIYVNGIPDDSSSLITGSIPANSDGLFIGADRFGGVSDFFFQGFLDGVRISDFAKTRKQIKDFMYQSIDQSNRLNPSAKELSFNFDGYGCSSTAMASDMGIFQADARYAYSSDLHSTPVSPMIRHSMTNFANDWTMKTSDRRIPATGSSGGLMKTDSLYFTGSTVGGLKLFLSLQHTSIQDLTIYLISPSGDSVKVYDQQSAYDFGSSNIATVFDDEAPSELLSNHYISVSPTIKPDSPLSELYGGLATGYWRLSICDDPLGMANDSGRVYAWGLYNDALLPVELSSFNASVNANNVTLNWTTTSELNNSVFEIERYADNASWKKVGTVNGSGTTSSHSQYTFTDRNLASGRYNYRIKQIDFNGNFEYFELENEISIGVPRQYELSQNYPNPFNPATKINFNLPFNTIVKLEVFDISGRLLKTILNNEFLNAGYYTKTFDGAGLSSGVYFYRMTSNSQGLSEDFTITKKMTLIK